MSELETTPKIERAKSILGYSAIGSFALIGATAGFFYLINNGAGTTGESVAGTTASVERDVIAAEGLLTGVILAGETAYAYKQSRNLDRYNEAQLARLSPADIRILKYD